MKKKIVFPILLSAVLLCLSGCGNSEGTAQDSVDTDAASVSASESEAADGKTETTPAEIANEEAGEIPVILTIDDREIPAVIYDTKAGQSVLAGLPYIVHLSKGSTDFCGDVGVDFEYDESDLQDGVQNGDLVYWIPGDDFTIFFDEYPPSGDGNSELASIGRILNDEDADFVIEYPGSSLDIAIRLDE